MGMWQNFLEWFYPVTETNKTTADTSKEPIIIKIPAEIYYKELAIYTAVSLISNGVSRSEIKTFRDGKETKGEDYFRLNVSPNNNETSSHFWHTVINKMIREGEALVVETSDGCLYCARSFSRKEERPILGDIFDCVQIGNNLTLDRTFDQNSSYLMRLDDVNVRRLIDGMYDDYGPILTAAAKKLKQSGGSKYKLHIEGTKAGDEEFNKEFEEYIKKQLKDFMEADSAVYPEFDGYTLSEDPAKGNSASSKDYVELQEGFNKRVAAAFHIPESMMTGNITSMKEVIGAFLTFGVDPYADAIAEALNKGAGYKNYSKGNYYKVDTGKIQHQNIFDLATAVVGLISSGTMCIDEIREELDRAPLNTDWSKKHFITKNFEEIEKFLKSVQEGGNKKE